jgi:hypothetical protein
MMLICIIFFARDTFIQSVLLRINIYIVTALQSRKMILPRATLLLSLSLALTSASLLPADVLDRRQASSSSSTMSATGSSTSSLSSAAGTVVSNGGAGGVSGGTGGTAGAANTSTIATSESGGLRGQSISSSSGGRGDVSGYVLISTQWGHFCFRLSLAVLVLLPFGCRKIMRKGVFKCAEVVGVRKIVPRICLVGLKSCI